MLSNVHTYSELNTCYEGDLQFEQFDLFSASSVQMSISTSINTSVNYEEMHHR